MLAGCERWIHSVFDDLGVGRIVTLYAEDVLGARWDLDACDGVYIGGGNTYHLLDLLRRSGMDTALRDFARSGRPISGGSAGAIILGKDIGHSEALGDPNDAGIEDTSGLDLLRDRNGRSWRVVPHYTEARRRIAEALAADTGTDVVCIAEDAGLIVEDGRWETAGTGEVRIVSPD
jgi:dipeptidase E